MDGATDASALAFTSSFPIVSSYHCTGAETITACVNSSSVTSTDIPSSEIYVFSDGTSETSQVTSLVRPFEDSLDAPAFNSPHTKRNLLCYTPLATSTTTTRSSPLSRSSEQCQTTNTESFNSSVLTPSVQPLSNAIQTSLNLVSSLSTKNASKCSEFGKIPIIKDSESSGCGVDGNVNVSGEIICANIVAIKQGVMNKNGSEGSSSLGAASLPTPGRGRELPTPCRSRGIPTVKKSKSERYITKSILIEPKNLFTRKPQLKSKNSDNPASTDFVDPFSKTGIRASGASLKTTPSQDGCPSVGREKKMVHLNNSKCDIFDISSGTRSKRGNTLSLSVPANIVEVGGYSHPQGNRKSSPKEQVRLKDTNLRVADLCHIDELSSKEAEANRNKDIEDNKKYLYFTSKV